MEQNKEKKINLSIVTPERKVVSKNVDFVSLPGELGSFGVLPNHTPFISTLITGIISFVENNAKTKVAFIGQGFAEVTGEKVIVLAEDALLTNEIDISRAQAAKKRAEERLKTQHGKIDISRANASLMRALTRLKAAGKL